LVLQLKHAGVCELRIPAWGDTYGLSGSGKIYLHKSSMESSLWSFDPESEFPKLAAPGSALPAGCCPFPILTPSAGRPHKAWLNLFDAMEGREYVQLIIVKARELRDYQKLWPSHSFFVLPEDADTLGIGAARFWALELARAICNECFRFCFIMDDNVRVWKCLPVGANDAYFENSPYPREVLANGSSGSKRDIPLNGVLKVLEDMDRDERAKFGMLGFWRLGRTPNVTKPFGRRHVYKAILYNLDVILGVNFNPKIKIWEDLEFNLRASGKVRVDATAGGSGGTSQKMTPYNEVGVTQQPDADRGVWISRSTMARDREGNERPLLGSADREGPAVICKFYRFAYVQHMSKTGGCAPLKPKGPPDSDSDDDGDKDDQDDMDVDMLEDLETQVVLKKQLVEELEEELEVLDKEEQRLEAGDLNPQDCESLDRTYEAKNEKQKDLDTARKELAAAEKKLQDSRQEKERLLEEAKIKKEAAAADAAAKAAAEKRKKQLQHLAEEKKALQQKLQLVGRNEKQDLLEQIKDVNQRIGTVEAEPNTGAGGGGNVAGSKRKAPSAGAGSTSADAGSS